MTTPFETSSPFSSNPSSTKQPTNFSNPPQDEFVIRTMQDDLLSLKNSGAVAPAPLLKEQPKVEEWILNEPHPAREVKQAPELTQKTVSNLNTQAPFTAPQNSNQLKEVAVPDRKEEINPSDKKSSTTKVVFFISMILILAVAGLGGYYFWMTKNTKQQKTPAATPTSQPTTTTPLPQTTPPTTTTTDTSNTEPTEKYSTENPNYLVLDLANISADDIKNILINAQRDLINSNPGSLYEFIVVDANNNPIAFPIFATAAKLNLSQNLLNSLNTNFSLYFYNDSGNIRLALSVDSKNKDIAVQELQKQEKTFPTDASLLFLGSTPELTLGSFNTGTYNNYSIRYLNLNAIQTLSIDYTVTDSKLIIGTSKNTLRATLDKLSNTKNTNSTPGTQSNPSAQPIQSTQTNTSAPTLSTTGTPDTK